MREISEVVEVSEQRRHLCLEHHIPANRDTDRDRKEVSGAERKSESTPLPVGRQGFRPLGDVPLFDSGHPWPSPCRACRQAARPILLSCRIVKRCCVSMC
ncbi:MAG: hypothetical protein JRJ13_15080 [Deltaproteobacteria bacterium]|nr:hypothetical protein [Deltaproteobacteria bacterium]